MSLINDALRRASQTEKNRPPRTATGPGMEPTPESRSSRLNLILAAVALVVLLLAGWFFWQWWHARNSADDTIVATAVAPAVTPRVVPPPAPKPAPVAAPVAPAKPAPAPVAVVPPTPVVAQPVTAPSALPNVANFTPTPWPVDLKLGGIFYSKTNARVLINGNIYVTGVDIQSSEKEVILKITRKFYDSNQQATIGNQYSYRYDQTRELMGESGDFYGKTE